MMQSDYIGWSVAILLSLLLHGMLFMQSGARIGADNTAVMHAPLITRLSFNPLEKKPLPQVLPSLEAQPPEAVKKVKPETLHPKQKAPAPLSPARTETAVEPATQAQSQVPVPVQGQQVMNTTDGLMQHKRQQYLHALMRHIESYKYYPRAARRRALEGDVKIAFVLRDDGFYEQLELDGRQKVLVNATRQALEAAKPLPAPPAEIELSRQIEMRMVYTLGD